MKLLEEALQIAEQRYSVTFMSIFPVTLEYVHTVLE